MRPGSANRLIGPAARATAFNTREIIAAAVIPNPVARFWRTLVRDLLLPFRPPPLHPFFS
jgi:hypothetical protein